MGGKKKKANDVLDINLSVSSPHFFKGMPFSVYGNAMIPPVAPIPDGAGGPIFNGPHAADPSWNSLIKMVSSSTENNGPQTVWTGPWAPHMNSVHMNQLG